MRKELIFDRNSEDLSEYMTRAAEGLRSIKTGIMTSYGLNLGEELPETEQEEFKQYVYALAVAEMERTEGKYCLRRHGFGEDGEDFLSNFKIVILKNLEKFNDSQHLAEDGKKYQFSTFLKHLSLEAVCMTYAQIHGVTRDVEKKFTLVLGTMKKLARERQMDMEQISPEMIHEARPSVSVNDIQAVIDFTRGRESLDKMTEEDRLEGEFLKGQEELDDSGLDTLDLSVERALDTFLGEMRDVEKFFMLVEIGCSEKYQRMTSSQLSCDPFFVHLVLEDDKFAKNVVTGDVVVKRPNRSSAKGVEEMHYENVKHVTENMIRYQRANAKKKWRKLSVVLFPEDICGRSGVEYFMEQWRAFVKDAR